MSWQAGDPYARAIDSLAPDVDWSIIDRPYAFPPYSLLGLTIQKIIAQRVPHLLLVAPYWPSKVWFPILTKISEIIYKIPFCPNQLTDLVTGQTPVNIKQMHLCVYVISGDLITSQDTELPTSLLLPSLSSKDPGEKTLKLSTHFNMENGQDIVRFKEFHKLPLV